MSMLEQIEEQVLQLPAKEQLALRDWLDEKIEDRLELTDGFKAEIEAGLQSFFSAWDASHSVTVGTQPTRARTYADNARLR
jgi:hypothetical protein